MEFLQRVQLAAQLAEEVEGEKDLPDASRVAHECRGWGIRAQLKPHQAEGVAWLIKRYIRGVNVILGDEMGLGKTLQAITLLSYLKSQRHACGPFLVLCPLSVTDGWASEFIQFAPELQVLKYIGDKEQREGIRRTICEHVNKQWRRSMETVKMPFDVLLTTYELAMIDVAFLSRFCWRYTIIDEAQRLKNSSSVLYKTLSDGYMIPRRLLLTGTPIQNNLSELWALLHFCMHLVFNDLEGFLSSFQPISKPGLQATGNNAHHRKQLELLRNILHVFMLRRTKAALVQNKTLILPSLSEVTIMVKMVQLQRIVYISILKKEMPKLVAALSKQVSHSSLQNVVVQLRKACSHPYLFDGVEPEPFQEGEHLVQASGKLLVLDMLLKKLYSGGHRVLIYAQMARSLDILQDFLEYRQYSYERLDGSVRAEERFAAVRSFSKASSSSYKSDYRTREEEGTEKPFVFLLTTRAGGVGLNLVAADTVIFYEQDWNPQADKQALQRAHRIGQTNPVLAINLITENSVEEVILHRSKRKLRLTYDVIGRDDMDIDEDGFSNVSSSELNSLIVFGLNKLDPLNEEAKGVVFSDDELLSKTDDLVEKTLQQRGKMGIDVGKKGSDIVNEGLDESIYRFEGKDFSVRKRDESDQTEIPEPSSQALLESWAKRLEDLALHSENETRQSRKRAPEASNSEEIRAEKQRKAAERKIAKWNAMGYESLAVEDPVMVPSELSANGHDGEVQFVFGDSTKPIKSRPQEAAIIFSFVDDSGVWGHGGMFTALSQLSTKISDAYVAARSAGDLHLSDLHLIPVSGIEGMDRLQSGSESQHEGPLWVGLAVVQTYDSRRKVPRSEISLPAMETCLRKAAASAVKKNASIHMPRITSHPGQDRKDWYAAERLLRKYSNTCGVNFYVYYFRRSNTS